MKRFMGVSLLALCAAIPAQAGMVFGFTKITNNAPNNISSQLAVEVSDLGGGIVSFKVTNNVGTASNMAQIYWDETDSAMDLINFGTAGLSVVSGPGPVVDFSIGGTPAELPGGNNAGPAFESEFRVSADSPAPHHGLNHASDSLTVSFSLVAGKTYADVLSYMNAGTLRLGSHVTGIGTTGQSDGYVTVPGTTVPAPAAIALGAIGAAMAAAFRRSN
ncbi:hypothetical protein RAS1_22490 [Phycisphaerae bacterium RAS1]|nr:hypothetical protein RAS1_22490 [Phycisphaerae bacterium RAS1]